MRHGNDLLSMADEERKRRMEEPEEKPAHQVMTRLKETLAKDRAVIDAAAAFLARIDELPTDCYPVAHAGNCCFRVGGDRHEREALREAFANLFGVSR